MADQALPITSPADLFQVAEAVARSGRRRNVRLCGKTLTIAIQPSGTGTPRRSRANGFLAAYGSVRPLARPLSDTEMTEIAADEAAQEAARAGLPHHARA